MPPALKVIGRVVGFIVITVALAATIVPRFLDRVYYRGGPSDHFTGQRFFNPDGDADTGPPGRGRASFFWNQLTGRDDRPPWPTTVTVRASTPLPRIDGDRMVATWVGHATVLVQAAGLNILTDPVWADHAGPFGLGPRRVPKPGIAFDDLPRIDLIVVSHNHYDHMDMATLKRLWDRDRPRIVTSLGNDAILRAAGIGATAVDWGGHLYLANGKLTDVPPPIACEPDDGFCAYPSVTVVRNHHWGSRWFADRNRALWSAFVIRTRAGAIFFAGDTGLGDGKWPAEAARLGPIRLAIIPIGAFRFQPGQMSSGSHIGPVQATQAFKETGATTGLPIHWGTFRLSYEGYTTPPGLLRAATRCAGVRGFDPVQIGRPVEVRPVRAWESAPPVNMERCLDTPAVRAMR